MKSTHLFLLLAGASLLALDGFAQTTAEPVHRHGSTASSADRMVWVPAQGDGYHCAAGSPHEVGSYMRESEARQLGRSSTVGTCVNTPLTPPASRQGTPAGVNAQS